VRLPEWLARLADVRICREEGVIGTHASACCTKAARRASVGVRAVNVGLSAAEWGGRASREARWRLCGDRFRRDPFVQQAGLCVG
jgi:hypothetical protein